MSIIPDELKTQTFPCPSCGQFISSEVDSCKFCSAQITEETRQAAIQLEFGEKKKIVLGRQKNSVILGIVIFAAGVGLIFNPIIAANYGSTQVSCLSPILIPVGVVMIILGLVGYYKEKRR